MLAEVEHELFGMDRGRVWLSLNNVHSSDLRQDGQLSRNKILPGVLKTRNLVGDLSECYMRRRKPTTYRDQGSQGKGREKALLGHQCPSPSSLSWSMVLGL